MRVVHARSFSKFIKATVIVFMLTGTYAATQAAPVDATAVNGGPGIGKAVINHLSSDSKSLLFQVNVENASGEKFIIVVKDENGSVLYRGGFTDKDFSKKFRVPKGETGKITFVVKSESTNKVESFEVNSNTRIVEEVVVRKVS